MKKTYVIYSKVLDWQLCSIERDYIKSIVGICDSEEKAREICNILNTDNYEEEFLWKEYAINDFSILNEILKKLGRKHL